MTLRQRLLERRQRNAELAQADAKNRCSYCRRALQDVRIIEVFGLDRRFCSQECLEAQMELDAMREARRA